MRTRPIVTLGLVGTVLLAAATLSASGPIGVYAIVERVVFEPNESAAERVQVWGAFAYADGGPARLGAASPARKGYMYFQLDPNASPAQRNTVRTEWADLKAVAGTGQAVAFGQWGYIGGFAGLDPSVQSKNPPYILYMSPNRGDFTDMRVRPGTEAPATPAMYQTNAGVVKIAEQGSHAAIVKQLKDALTAK
jgi:hypothetical protein